MEPVQSYNFTVEHIPGRHNVVADALSRRPDFFLASLVVKSDNSLLSRVQQDALQDEEYQRYRKAAELGCCRDMEVRGGLLWLLPGSSQAPLTGGAAWLYISQGDFCCKLLPKAHDTPHSKTLGEGQDS